MQAIVLALGASLSWGLADFFGPLQGRKLGVLRALVYVQLGGLFGIALIVGVRGKGPADVAALLAIPAAISGTLGLFAYYRGIAVGAISIVAPIAGISAVVPVIVGIASGESPSPWQLAGIVCALAGVFLAAREPRSSGQTRLAAGGGVAVLAATWLRRLLPLHACGRQRGFLVGVVRLSHRVDERDHGRGRNPAAEHPHRAASAASPRGDRLRRHVRQPAVRSGLDDRPRKHHLGAGVAVPDRHRRACAHLAV